jgi:hypothetical protein
MPLVLVLAMLVAELLDRAADVAAHGGGLFEALAGPASPAGLAGFATVAVLGTVAARREARVPCARLTRRLTAMVAVLLCGLLVQELVGLLLHAEHAAGLANLAVHAGTVVLPAAAACGVGVGLVVGVAHVARRVWPLVVAAVVLAFRAADPRAADGRRDLVPPVGPLLARHLAGRAPPALQG